MVFIRNIEHMDFGKAARAREGGFDPVFVLLFHDKYMVGPVKVLAFTVHRARGLVPADRTETPGVLRQTSSPVGLRH